MKRFFSVVMAVVFALTFIGVSLNSSICAEVAFAASENPVISFDEYEDPTESRAVIKSNMACSGMTMYAAAYNGNKLVAIKRTELELSSGYNVINTDVDWSDIDKDKVKIFVWNDDVKPFAEFEYEVLRPAQSKLSLFEVTGNREITYNGGEAYRLTGYHNGKESVFILYNVRGYGDTAPQDFAAGDILYIAVPDENGVISYAEIADTGVEKFEGVVASTPLVEMAANGYYSGMDMTVEIASPDEGYITLECSNIPDIDKYLGKYVEINAVDYSVATIQEKEGYNTVVAINSNQLVVDGDRYYDDEGIIGYREEGEYRVTSLDLSSSVLAVANYGSEFIGDINTTADLVDFFDGYPGKIEFISNDGDYKIDTINCIAYSQEAVVERVNSEDGLISFDCYVGDLDDYDTEDEDLYSVVIRDDEAATIEDIKAGDVVSTVETADDSLKIYHVSSETVDGSVESYDEEFVGINGIEYRISSLMYSEPSDLVGITGKFFINVCGEIAYDKPVRNEKYALILAAGETGGISGGYELEVVLEDGTIATYPLAAKAYIEGVNDSDRSDTVTYNYITSLLESDGWVYRVKAADIENVVFEVLVKNDKITKLIPLAAEATTSGKRYDADNMTYGAICFDEETVVVSVDSDGLVETENVKIGKVFDFMTDGEGEDFTLIEFDKDYNDIAGLVIGFGLTYKGNQTDDEEDTPEVITKKALVLAASETSGISGGYELEVVLEDGTSGAYFLASKAFVEGETGKSDDETFDYITNLLDENYGYYRVNSANVNDVVFEITIKNDEIAKLEHLPVSTTETGRTYDAENLTYGAICFDEETVIISVDSDGLVETENVKIGTVSDFMFDGYGENFSLAAFDVDNNDIAGLVVGTDLYIPIPQDGDTVIVSSKRTIVINGDEGYLITGLQGGKEVTYTIYDEDAAYTGDPYDIVEGAVVLVGFANAEGIVSDFEVLYNQADGVLAADAAYNDTYNLAGAIDETNAPTESRFFLVDPVNNGESNVYYVAEDGVVMRSSANYTLVDYTESPIIPEISKKSKGKSLFSGLSKYDYKVFVRYYDDELAEVVVYRYTADN